MRRLFLSLTVLCLATPTANAARGVDSYAALKTGYKAAIKQWSEESKAA